MNHNAFATFLSASTIDELRLAQSVLFDLRSSQELRGLRPELREAYRLLTGELRARAS